MPANGSRPTFDRKKPSCKDGEASTLGRSHWRTNPPSAGNHPSAPVHSSHITTPKLRAKGGQARWGGQHWRAALTTSCAVGSACTAPPCPCHPRSCPPLARTPSLQQHSRSPPSAAGRRGPSTSTPVNVHFLRHRLGRANHFWRGPGQRAAGRVDARDVCLDLLLSRE